MDHFTGDAKMTPFLHVPWWHIKRVSFCHTYSRNEDPFLKRPSIFFFTKEQEALSLSTGVRQSSAVLSTVYTVGIVASASILLTETSWPSRSTLELNLWFVLIFCLRSYPPFNHPFHLKDLESDHENSSLHWTTTSDMGVSTFVSR